MDTEERLCKLERELVELRKSFEIICLRLNLLEMNAQPLQVVGKPIPEGSHVYRITYGGGSENYPVLPLMVDIRAQSADQAMKEAGRAIPSSALILRCEVLK